MDESNQSTRGYLLKEYCGGEDSFQNKGYPTVVALMSDDLI
jgi:hypothetical protein